MRLHAEEKKKTRSIERLKITKDVEVKHWPRGDGKPHLRFPAGDGLIQVYNYMVWDYLRLLETVMLEMILVLHLLISCQFGHGGVETPSESKHFIKYTTVLYLECSVLSFDISLAQPDEVPCTTVHSEDPRVLTIESA
jgi:hypothetical protein